MAHVADRHDTLTAAFDAVKRRTPGLESIREAAFHHFLDRGYPTTREEEWKFTNVAPIAALTFEPSSAESPSHHAVAPLVFTDEASRIIINNGRVNVRLDALRLPAGVHALSSSHASAADVRAAGLTTLQAPADGKSNPFVSLNTALFEDALIVRIDPHAVVSDPIHIVHVTTPGARPTLVAPRILVVAGEHSQATIIESYVGADHQQALVAAVTEIALGPSAVIDHVKYQHEAPSAFHMSSTFVRLDRASTFASRALSFGARIARNDISAVLNGEGAECTLNGLYIARGDSLIDTHTTIDHAQPHCPSHEVYKGILAGRARAVFNGKIIVRPDAQKTDAKQTNKALLLTDDAQINTKPQLEIFADDVKCTHGAAIGQLDEDALFYLRARGIAEPDAKSMLIHAFAGEILDGVAVAAVREHAIRVLEEQLSLA